VDVLSNFLFAQTNRPGSVAIYSTDEGSNAVIGTISISTLSELHQRHRLDPVSARLLVVAQLEKFGRVMQLKYARDRGAFIASVGEPRTLQAELTAVDFTASHETFSAILLDTGASEDPNEILG
jgi:hypothetical protein